jgi:dipeptidyl aminopeptidase/acylaminoacyl peptidase
MLEQTQGARTSTSRGAAMLYVCAASVLLIGSFNCAIAQGPATPVSNQRISRYFTVRDSIEMSRFDTSDGAPLFSPDKRFFSVVTSRGIIETNEIESTLRIFRTAQVRRFLQSEHPSGTTSGWPIAKLKAIPRNNYTIFYAPVISQVRWQEDSTGLLFLGQNNRGERGLYSVDVSSGSVRELTPEGYDVRQYERVGQTTVYTAISKKQSIQVGRAINADATDVSGMPLASLLPQIDEPALYCDVWVMRNGRRWQLHATGRQPIHLANHSPQLLSISPDGKDVALLLPSNHAPASWGLYEPTKPYLRVRPADPITTDRFNFVRPMQYAVIGLDSGEMRFIVNGPNADALGYLQANLAVWSSDSKSLLLTNTFLSLDEVGNPERSNRLRPCSCAIVDLLANSSNCIASDPIDHSHHSPLVSARFGRSNNEVVLTFGNSKQPVGKRYDRQGNVWQQVSVDGTEESARYERENHPARRGSSIAVEIKEDPNTPPALYASEATSSLSRKIWDPNPPLASFNLGEVMPFHWTDRTGYQWMGQLVRPPDYVAGRRYPLVIQTYGFSDGFVSDGLFPTASAVRPLAAAGIMVLQMPRRTDHNATAQEAQDQILGINAAIEQLTSEELIDPQKVGIVGFSRTSYHVEKALINNPDKFAAATIADGMDGSYMQYLYSVGDASDIAQDIYGAKPFGAGLKEWTKFAPGFNLDKVTTPLRIETISFASILTQWEAYASLFSQGKPVDLIYFPYGDHLLQKPLERMASSQGNVDWFRFWLEGEEDPDPSKANQYARWRRMRESLKAKLGS